MISMVSSETCYGDEAGKLTHQGKGPSALSKFGSMHSHLYLQWKCSDRLPDGNREMMTTE